MNAESDPVARLAQIAARLGIHIDGEIWRQAARGPTDPEIVATLRDVREHPVIVRDYQPQMRALLQSLAATSTVAGAAAATVLDAADTVPPPPPVGRSAPTRAPAPDCGTEAAPTERAADGLPGPSPAPVPTAAQVQSVRNHPRWWPLATAIAVAVVGITAASWVAYDNYQTGLGWQAQYAASEADNDALQAENDTLESDLKATKHALERSEADVVVMEAKVANIANEKARVEDEREHITALAERVAEVADAYDDVAAWFQSCRAEQAALTEMVFDFEAYFYAGQTWRIYEQIDRAGNSCGTAESQLAALRRYVDALRR